MDDPDERSGIQKYYDDEALFAELANNPGMPLMERITDSAGLPQQSSYEYLSALSSSYVGKATITPLKKSGNDSGQTRMTGHLSQGPSSAAMSGEYKARPRLHCDDLMEYLRHEPMNANRRRPRRGRGAGPKDSAVANGSSATNNDSAGNNVPFADSGSATNDSSTTNDLSITTNNSATAQDSPAIKNPSPPGEVKSIPAEPKVRYRGVSEGPRLPSLKGVPDWYIDAHKELKAKHPYDFSHFIEGYQFYAEGPSTETEAKGKQKQEEVSAVTDNDYPPYRSATPMPPYRPPTPLPPIAPLNHPAVDSRLPHFQPPSYGRFRYSEAVSADTFHISEQIEKVRLHELYIQKKGVPTSGSPYVDRLRMSVKYVVMDEYPTDLLDMYGEGEPKALCASCQGKECVPEIRVEGPEEGSSSELEGDFDLPGAIKEPGKLTVPCEEVPDTFDLPRAPLKVEADARSVSEKSDGSANSYGDLFDYYSQASGPSLVRKGEGSEHASVPDTADGNKRSSYGVKEREHFVPALTPLVEGQKVAQFETPVNRPKEAPELQMPSHPLQALEKEVNAIPDVQETALATSAEVKTDVQNTNTDTTKEHRVPMKPLPAYVEHGPDEYAGRRLSLCDGTNFWRDDFSIAGGGIQDRVIAEKPVAIPRSVSTPVITSNRRVPQPATIVGSQNPPREIKDTNSLRRPTIVHVEPTSPTPPPVPPKEPITPELSLSPECPPTPPPKTIENNYRPVQPVYGPAPHPSMADIGRGMQIEEDDIYTQPYKSNPGPLPTRAVPSKAMKVLGVEMNEVQQTSSFESGAFVPFTPYAGSKLEQEVNHATNRNSKLDQDPSKSSKSLLGFRGGVSNLFRKRDKVVVPNSLNTEVPQVDKRASIETGTSTPDSPRPGLFKRLFNNKRQSDAPSTAPSIESYGGSHKNHESWTSSRASGDTGITSNDDGYVPYGAYVIPNGGRASMGSSLSPAEYLDNRINPNFTVTLNDKPLKTKRSLFFGRDKSEEQEMPTPGISIPVPKEEKRGSVFGFFQKDKTPAQTPIVVEDIKKEILEQAQFERSDEYTRLKQKAFDDKQKAKMIPGQKGYFNSKGEYFRAKNPLELDLCDSENSEPLSFSEVKGKFEKEGREPAKGSKNDGSSAKMTPSNPNAECKVEDVSSQPEYMFGDHEIPTPIVEEPETVASEAIVTSHESITVKSPVQPGFTPENEPPSHWSDDSDEEDNDGHGSQPPTPSNPSFGRSTKSHKRTGSGSSNLGTGPMFMKKAVRKFKANRKSAEVRISTSLASKGNRDSVMSQTSNGSNRTPVTASAPPIPAPPVPARGSTDAGPRPQVRASRIPIPKVSVTAPQSSRLTTGTYHDQNENVVHHFGGTFPERSGSSLGHRGDRTSAPINLPERSKSSLGHNVGEEKLVRDGIKCTADVTANDIQKWAATKATLEKQAQEEEKRKQRKEQIRLKEVEARIKREKRAAKADSWLVKEKKRHDDAIEKSKFRVGLATRLADRLIQRESDSLKSKGVFVPNSEINGWI
ncbi:hypothetical protein TWF718_005014 [Orbilia javanica]|uniref:Uncharacterized protein n=1 Tax=Orbilia javanica TaxID=47235 RepID=A0AAN8MYL7_9PEZI